MIKNLKAFAIAGSLVLAPIINTSSIAEEEEKFKGVYVMTGLGLTNTTDINISTGGKIKFEYGGL